MLLVCYYWLVEAKFTTIKMITGLAFQTVSNKLKDLRELVASVVKQMDLSIGGPGKNVQIDESKFGKQKKTRGKRGHRVEGGWVFGGTEVHSDIWGKNDFFAVCVENRKAEMLLPLIA